ncbi:hypothetical protein F7725_001136 [Dissostichus mawsoni]|uniref:Uncharacterized protein n=1 Tax=Dissostichus mawsoni TaxID=36200 RepID=A0A7J5ZIA0_DISMA|nr:hypothetical protein F7725_001136 [Dissostichus mawsoni]
MMNKSCPVSALTFTHFCPVYILVFIVGLPFWWCTTNGSKWIFGDVFCKITRFCFNLNLYGSIGFLTCISVSGTWLFEIMGRITVLHSVGISVLVWLLVSIQSSRHVLQQNVGNILGNVMIPRKIYVEDYLKYSLGWTLLGFVSIPDRSGLLWTCDCCALSHKHH